MTRHFRILIIAVLAVTGAMPVLAMDQPVPQEGPLVFEYLPREEIVIQTHGGQDYMFDVEVASKGEDQQRGLMYRTHLNNDSGMLFLFPDEEERSFWMKNTLIPLDIIFIGRDGVINHIHHSAKPQDETHITTDRPALAVLEVNGGLAGTLNIREGDKVLHPVFRNVVVAPE